MTVTLTLPQPKAVLDLLSMFIGSRPPLAPGPSLDLACPSPGTYATWLKGANGQVEGAIFSDLAASLYLGGELLMMPPATLQEMMAEGEASDAVLDALGEVFNNVRALLNRIEMNTHVTPTDPMIYEAPDPNGPDGWVLNPSRRVDLRGNTKFGPASLTILSR
jgi:hypothetical protein